MVLFLPLLLLATLLALASGGRIQNLETARIRFDWLLVLGLGILSGTPALVRVSIGPTQRILLGVWVLVGLMCLIVCVLNRRVPWLWVAALGLATNLVVVIANLGMPVLLGNISPALVDRAADAVATSWLHQPVLSTTRFVFLADVVPVSIGGVGRGMASVGDLLLAVGAAASLFCLISGESHEAV